MMAMIEFFTGYLHRAIHEEREPRPQVAIREGAAGRCKIRF